MKERPILFSGPMVRALLDGSKTQTRRVVKPQPKVSSCKHEHTPELADMARAAISMILSDQCPYGKPGGRLWVRETHAPQSDCWGAWERRLRGDGGAAPVIHYFADFVPFQDDRGFTVCKPFIEKWRPSIHMPRWASRIQLEITGVRVERLQDISEADARAEGSPDYEEGTDAPPDEESMTWSFRASYQRLWESINGPGSWALNPWVWVIEFKKVTP